MRCARRPYISELDSDISVSLLSTPDNWHSWAARSPPFNAIGTMSQVRLANFGEWSAEFEFCAFLCSCYLSAVTPVQTTRSDVEGLRAAKRCPIDFIATVLLMQNTENLA